MNLTHRVTSSSRELWEGNFCCGATQGQPGLVSENELVFPHSLCLTCQRWSGHAVICQKVDGDEALNWCL